MKRPVRFRTPIERLLTDACAGGNLVRIANRSEIMKLGMLFAVGTLSCHASFAFAQSGPKMTQAQLVELTQDGVVLVLGGKGEGYAGKLTLNGDGTAQGSAKTDAGDKIPIAGTWEVKGGKFCRVLADLNEGKKVCKVWYMTSDTSAEVFNSKKRIGLNSW